MFKRLFPILITAAMLLCSCAEDGNTGEIQSNEQDINNENVQSPADNGLEQVTDPGVYSIFG